MTNQVLQNLITVGLLVLIMVITGLVLNKGIKSMRNAGDSIASILSNKLNFRYSILMLEVLIVAMIITLWFTMNQNHPIWTVTLMFMGYICAVVIVELRDKNPKAPSFLRHLRVLHEEDYVINRILLFVSQLPSILFLIFALVFTLSLFTSLKWPDPYYFVGFLALPIYTNVWIYFTFKLKLRDDTTMNARRIIAYIFLVIYVSVDTYNKFNGILNQQTSEKPDVISFFLSAASVLFIALDRLLKAWTDDYKKFTDQVMHDQSCVRSKNAS